MYIRSNTWSKTDLSWAFCTEELLHSFESMGHDVSLISTNGTDGMRYWNEEKLLKNIEFERKMRKSNSGFGLDICMTVPENFPKRFLPTSKVKMGLCDYESSILPARWTQYQDFVDFIIPGSQYVAEMFRRNGWPQEKIRVVHHGVDIKVFNPSAIPMKLKTEKGYKFLCVAEPHARKQLEGLLDVYCERFSASDDVVLVLKTKLFSKGDALKGYEIDLRPKLIALKNKYGDKIPEIKILSKRYESLASLYTACDSFVLMTASEGFGIPYLEALACGLVVIAPRHGGQLDFLNDSNSLLCRTGVRFAASSEQYWGSSAGATVGDPDITHFGDLMRRVFESKGSIRKELLPNMLKSAEHFTWQKAAEKIIDIARSTGRV